ncbi:MAG: S8 family peptidase [Bacteroidetes bacterium]|nr:S8 family peptidase [Bacteroidota bacterium]
MKKSVFILAMLSSSIGYAQTVEDRQEIVKNINPKEMALIKTKLDAAYQQDEENVKQYLASHRNVERSFYKNGNSYFLKRIDKDGNPIFINTKDTTANTTVKVNSIQNGGSLGVNITGQNMVLGVWDGGQVNATHELLSGKVTMQTGQTVTSSGGDAHQTAVTGIAIGKNLGNTAQGVAPDATSQNYDWNNDVAEMQAFAGNGFLVSNHSYGYGNGEGTALWTFGAYDQTSEMWDTMLKATPNYLPFVAVGNEQNPTAMNGGQHVNGNWNKGGFDMITGSSAAKNVMTVGSVEANKAMTDYSNWGPTDDGRVKPDLVAQGSNMDAPLYTSNNGYTGQVAASSGTSYAAPVAAAAGLLLQQYYKSIFNKYMTAASLKALMLHTAEDLGNPGPDAKFGWGLLNVEKAANTIKQMQSGGSAKLVEFTTNPTNDSSSEKSVSGNTAGGGSARASICWTDDEGTEQTSTDGIDNTSRRLVYGFDILFRQQGTPFIDSRPFAPLSISSPNANAAVSTSWFTNNVDNYKQANIATTNLGNNLIVYIRKHSTSPAAVRNFSILITGLKISNATLGTTENNTSNEIVFFDNDDNKIKLISNKNKSFGDYQIFDMSGRVVQKGFSKTNEIESMSLGKGSYILQSANTKVLKFRK